MILLASVMYKFMCPYRSEIEWPENKSGSGSEFEKSGGTRDCKDCLLWVTTYWLR